MKDMETQIIGLLKKLISIDSAYPNEGIIIGYLESFFKKKGYETKRQKVEPGRYNLLVEKGTGKKSILLYSHADTVAASSGWTRNPITPKVSGDRITGLGAWDMKGGMAVNILTFLKHEPKNYKVKIVFCVDEENISMGGHVLSNSDFMKDVECIISPEPAFFNGNQGVVIGRPGRAVFELKITASPKHYALYEKKYDINFFVADLVSCLGNIYKSRRDRKQFVFIRKIRSQSLGISTPQEMTLELDSSVIPPYRSRDVMNMISEGIKSIELKYNNYFKTSLDYVKRSTPFLESYEIRKGNKYLKILSKSIHKNTGKPAITYFRSSVADENIFGSMGMTVLSIGPTGKNAHSANEWVSISSLKKLYNILNNFLENIDI